MVVRIRLHLLEQVESTHATRVQSEIEDHAVEVLLVELAHRLFGGADRHYLHIVVGDKLDDALSLRLVVLHDEKTLRHRVDEG